MKSLFLDETFQGNKLWNSTLLGFYLFYMSNELSLAVYLKCISLWLTLMCGDVCLFSLKKMSSSGKLKPRHQMSNENIKVSNLFSIERCLLKISIYPLYCNLINVKNKTKIRLRFKGFRISCW